MFLRIVLTGLATFLLLTVASAGGDLPVPLPVSGVSGPVGLAVGGAAYLAYRLYKHFGRKG